MIPARCLTPNIVEENKKQELYLALTGKNPRAKEIFTSATENVLQIMLKNGMTAAPDRRAVWCEQEISYHGLVLSSSREKVGESFPDSRFEEGCYDLCQEKVRRNKENCEHVTSHESRNPQKGKWGGSVYLTFASISADKKAFIITCISASSGLKEWEDLALELGKYRYLGLVRFQDQQVQEILYRVDMAVKNDPAFRPKGMSISEYVKKVFDAIDADLVKKD